MKHTTLLLLGLAAVSFSSRPAPAQRADTTVIVVGAPVYPGGATLIEEATLSRGSAVGDQPLSEVRALSIGADGSLYLVDRSGNTSSVRKYDAMGRYVRSYGRQGSGPGEFNSPADVIELADGRVVVSDFGGYLVYAPTGEPLARLPVLGPPPGRAILLDPSGIILAYVPDRRPRGQRPGSPSLPGFVLARLRLDGIVVDTMDNPGNEFPRPARVEAPVRSPMGTTSVRSTDLPFVGSHSVRWSPLGYFVTSNPATYAIDLRVPRAMEGSVSRPWQRGDPIISIRRDAPAVPVERAERSDWRQAITIYMRLGASRWTWTGPDIPSTKPPIRDFFVAGDGRIWVRPSQPARLDPTFTIPSTPDAGGRFGPEIAAMRWVEPEVYDLLEPDGRYLGQVRMPSGISPRAARGDTLWTVLVDAAGVPTVKRFRLQWKQ
jgi:hypothetical protein